MNAGYGMARRPSKPGDRHGVKAADEPEDLPACPAGEPEAVEAHWRALVATCDRMTARDVPALLEYCRVLADLDEARRHVREGGAMVLSKSGDLTENPWADRERKLRAQSIQIGKGLDHVLNGRVVSGAAAAKAAEADRKAEAKAKAEADRKAEAKERRAEEAAKRKAAREAVE